MELYYCKFCNITINMKLKTKHENTKSHLYNANYISEEVIYHDVVKKDIIKIIFKHANIFKNRFNEFIIKVKCEINDKKYTTQKETYWRLTSGDYVVKGEMRKQIRGDDDMILREICWKIYNGMRLILHSNFKTLRINFIADYDKMTLRHYLQQPRPILESQLIKRMKNKPKINKRFFAFILKRHEIITRLYSNLF